MAFTREQFANALETAEMQAFIRVIRTGEGTLGDEGYRRLFGGGTFDSFADHPRIAVTKGRITSTAAGAGQFLSKTWDWIRSIYKWEDFSPRNQDEAIVALIAHRGALVDVLAGRFDSAVGKCAKEWASLPGSPYGQPTLTLSRAREIYAAALTGAPVEERVVSSVVPVQREGAEMNPFVITAVSKAIEMVPDLFRMFGGKKAEQNAALSERVVSIAQEVTGQANAQAAVEALEASPEMQAEFRERIFQQKVELEQLAEKRVESAREFVKGYRNGEATWGRFTFPELLSAFLTIGAYGLGIGAIFFSDISGELKAAILGALVVQASGDIRGFWFGASVQKKVEVNK